MRPTVSWARRRGAWGGGGGGGGEFAVNLPDGYSVLADTTWASTSTSGFTIGSTFVSNGNATIASEAGPDVSTSLSIRHAAGIDDGYGGRFWPGISQALSPAVKGVFHAFSFKRSAAFVSHAVADKVVYPNSNILNTYPVGATTSGQYQWVLQTQTGPGGAGYNLNLYANQNGYSQSSPFTCINDTWYRVEVQQEYGTGFAYPGYNRSTAIANGDHLLWDHVFRLWISTWTGSAWSTPVLTHQYSDLVFTWTDSTPTQGVKFTEADWDLYMGGGAGATLPADQFTYFNRTYVGTKPL